VDLEILGEMMPDKHGSKGDFNLEQNQNLSREMSHWLDLLDNQFVEYEVPLPKRPLKALLEMLEIGAIDLKFGDSVQDVSAPYEHIDELWFQVLFDAVEFWYRERYGEVVLENRSSPLEGVIVIRGVPYPIQLPANRRKVEQEGETAWMYFEDALGEGETEADFIIDGPDLSKFTAAGALEITDTASIIANTLRFVEFRRVTANHDDVEVNKLIASVLTYLQQASRRLISSQVRERGPAWFDLQMAAESALKASIRYHTGEQPFEHNIVELAKTAKKTGVRFDTSELRDWPSFKEEISYWRYGQGKPYGLKRFFASYLIALRLAKASLHNIPETISPGFGLLLRYAPWKLRRPINAE
jgi:HEPN domain-containing protein